MVVGNEVYNVTFFFKQKKREHKLDKIINKI